MSLNCLPGMETSAVSVLKRAVELDQSSRFQESLVCYQEGIQLLLDVLKAVKDDSKKVHYREKIKGYMDRAEQIKDHLNKVKEEGKYHEQIKITEDATGFSYETLFKPYIKEGLTEVWVEDPYIRHVHQLYNFVRFCEMLLKAKCNVKKIHLLTSQDEDSSSQQVSALAEIKQSLQTQNVCLDIKYSSTIHDREIRCNWTDLARASLALALGWEEITAGTYSNISQNLLVFKHHSKKIFYIVIFILHVFCLR
ncbi:MIT domain-containing protein 1 isoform X1 [Colossoma macropomum]|uniref:MIT domain-containing protein 1 isoform X1 n=1 Tax=Colossoma macropomum TaxID=42526 RepID=UPI001863C404|nr:MIT domain-containing protein 1 isoform X1 [Colossoma macropomum]